MEPEPDKTPSVETLSGMKSSENNKNSKELEPEIVSVNAFHDKSVADSELNKTVTKTSFEMKSSETSQKANEMELEHNKTVIKTSIKMKSSESSQDSSAVKIGSEAVLVESNNEKESAEALSNDTFVETDIKEEPGEIENQKLDVPLPGNVSVNVDSLKLLEADESEKKLGTEFTSDTFPIDHATGEAVLVNIEPEVLDEMPDDNSSDQTVESSQKPSFLMALSKQLSKSALEDHMYTAAISVAKLPDNRIPVWFIPNQSSTAEHKKSDDVITCMTLGSVTSDAGIAEPVVITKMPTSVNKAFVGEMSSKQAHIEALQESFAGRRAGVVLHSDSTGSVYADDMVMNSCDTSDIKALIMKAIEAQVPILASLPATSPVTSDENTTEVEDETALKTVTLDMPVSMSAGIKPRKQTTTTSSLGNTTSSAVSSSKSSGYLTKLLHIKSTSSEQGKFKSKKAPDTLLSKSIPPGSYKKIKALLNKAPTGHSEPVALLSKSTPPGSYKKIKALLNKAPIDRQQYHIDDWTEATVGHTTARSLSNKHLFSEIPASNCMYKPVAAPLLPSNIPDIRRPVNLLTSTTNDPETFAHNDEPLFESSAKQTTSTMSVSNALLTSEPVASSERPVSFLTSATTSSEAVTHSTIAQNQTHIDSSENQTSSTMFVNNALLNSGAVASTSHKSVTCKNVVTKDIDVDNTNNSRGKVGSLDSVPSNELLEPVVNLEKPVCLCCGRDFNLYDINDLKKEGFPEILHQFGGISVIRHKDAYICCVCRKQVNGIQQKLGMFFDKCQRYANKIGRKEVCQPYTGSFHPRPAYQVFFNKDTQTTEMETGYLNQKQQLYKANTESGLKNKSGKVNQNHTGFVLLTQTDACPNSSLNNQPLEVLLLDKQTGKLVVDSKAKPDLALKEGVAKYVSTTPNTVYQSETRTELEGNKSQKISERNEQESVLNDHNYGHDVSEKQRSGAKKKLKIEDMKRLLYWMDDINPIESVVFKCCGNHIKASTICQQILHSDSMKQICESQILKEINLTAALLNQRNNKKMQSELLKKDFDDMKNFCWNDVFHEMCENFPFMVKLFLIVANQPAAKLLELIPRFGMAYSILMNTRDLKMSRVQRLISNYLLESLSPPKLHGQLSPLGICMSHRMSSLLLENKNSPFDIEKIKEAKRKQQNLNRKFEMETDRNELRLERKLQGQQSLNKVPASQDSGSLLKHFGQQVMNSQQVRFQPQVLKPLQTVLGSVNNQHTPTYSSGQLLNKPASSGKSNGKLIFLKLHVQSEANGTDQKKEEEPAMKTVCLEDLEKRKTPDEEKQKVFHLHLLSEQNDWSGKQIKATQSMEKMSSAHNNTPLTKTAQTHNKRKRKNPFSAQSMEKMSSAHINTPSTKTDQTYNKWQRKNPYSAPSCIIAQRVNSWTPEHLKKYQISYSSEFILSSPCEILDKVGSCFSIPRLTSKEETVLECFNGFLDLDVDIGTIQTGFADLSIARALKAVETFEGQSKHIQLEPSRMYEYGIDWLRYTIPMLAKYKLDQVFEREQIVQMVNAFVRCFGFSEEFTHREMKVFNTTMISEPALRFTKNDGSGYEKVVAIVEVNNDTTELLKPTSSEGEGSSADKMVQEGRLFEKLAGELLLEVPYAFYPCVFGLAVYKTSVMITCLNISSDHLKKLQTNCPLEPDERATIMYSKLHDLLKSKERLQVMRFLKRLANNSTTLSELQMANIKRFTVYHQI